jgi:choline dehydrogenase
MSTMLQIAAAALYLAAGIGAAPAHRNVLNARRLLGSSFGVPGNATFDYVVVGGGNAGLGMAYRLAEGGHSVAVIEAGSF